ncbi:phosphatase domain-containing putative toxin [Cognatishimia activa]|uniref:Protein tyrosine/serine phosphatase n=1 Tax=Cognatishimia activa TaxID=1715691 RepID=A0A0P1IQC6_9RHOB|nr:tyrosine-protein phosphatase [Cognatishimia activa]CUJ16633.1 Protein tyrosine/serine phosphatase [Cognatishimia activa]CUK25820.1 Protein tyrosine/serine phosphatase [Cognatishimia activa]
MSGKLMQRIKEWERKSRARYSHDIVDPEERKKSLHYNDWVDHGILRYRWHNFAEIAPGIYRSNHPNHARFETYRDLGVKTVLNLRGKTHHAHYYFEEESCAELGMELIDIPLRARAAPQKDLLLQTLDVLEKLDQPTLMHCKSGADRTGLVSAMYLLHILNKPVSEARKMLSVRFLHLNFTKTGILDYVIDLYARRVAQGPISFKEWIETEYDAEATKAEFKKLGFWQRIKL